MINDITGDTISSAAKRQNTAISDEEKTLREAIWRAKEGDKPAMLERLNLLVDARLANS